MLKHRLFGLVASIALAFGASSAQASYHWWHVVNLSCVLDIGSCTHIDQNSDMRTTSETFDGNVKLTDQIKVVWTNGTCATVHKNAGDVTASGQVTHNKTMTVTLGQGETQSLNVSCTAGSKDKVGGQIGYNPSWTSNQSQSFSESVTVGAGITDKNPDCDVPAGKSMVWRVDVYGKRGSATMKVFYQHWCDGLLFGRPIRVCYSNDGNLMGMGSASGENPVTVQMVWLGIQ